jgi:hypothetical protein
MGLLKHASGAYRRTWAPDRRFPYDFFTNCLPISYDEPCQIKGAGRFVSRAGHSRGGSVQDLIFVVVTIAFFALSLGYVEFCDRIR